MRSNTLRAAFIRLSLSHSTMRVVSNINVIILSTVSFSLSDISSFAHSLFHKLSSLYTAAVSMEQWRITNAICSFISLNASMFRFSASSAFFSASVGSLPYPALIVLMNRIWSVLAHAIRKPTYSRCCFITLNICEFRRHHNSNALHASFRSSFGLISSSSSSSVWNRQKTSFVKLRLSLPTSNKSDSTTGGTHDGVHLFRSPAGTLARCLRASLRLLSAISIEGTPSA